MSVLLNSLEPRVAVVAARPLVGRDIRQSAVISFSHFVHRSGPHRGAAGFHQHPHPLRPLGPSANRAWTLATLGCGRIVLPLFEILCFWILHRRCQLCRCKRSQRRVLEPNSPRPPRRPVSAGTRNRACSAHDPDQDLQGGGPDMGRRPFQRESSAAPRIDSCRPNQMHSAPAVHSDLPNRALPRVLQPPATSLSPRRALRRGEGLQLTQMSAIMEHESAQRTGDLSLLQTTILGALLAGLSVRASLPYAFHVPGLVGWTIVFAVASFVLAVPLLVMHQRRASRKVIESQGRSAVPQCSGYWSRFCSGSPHTKVRQGSARSPSSPEPSSDSSLLIGWIRRDVTNPQA